MTMVVHGSQFYWIMQALNFIFGHHFFTRDRQLTQEPETHDFNVVGE